MRIEDCIESETIKSAEAVGWFCRKTKWRGKAEAPDVVFIKGTRTVWIEFKSPAVPARDSQLNEHKKMRAAGAEVHVVDTIEQGRKVLGLR